MPIKSANNPAHKEYFIFFCRSIRKFHNVYHIFSFNLPKRKRNRLNGYSYDSSAAYFVTICIYKRTMIVR